MDTIYTKAHRRLVRSLRQARVNAGLTQVQVAAMLEKPQPFMSQLESGNRRIDVIELAQLCNLYKVDMVELLSRLRLQKSVQSHRSKR
jgi:transcriptional regulator with XRE-family HTH domain